MEVRRPLSASPSGSADLRYATFLGGASWDHAAAVAVDAMGCAYVTGYTESTDFPTVYSAVGSPSVRGKDVFVVKVSAADTLVYAALLGGSDEDIAYALAVDAAGNAYVTGSTRSNDWPTTPGAFDRTYNQAGDAFVAKLGPQGQLLYASYIGASGEEEGHGIAVDQSGAIYLTGWTNSSQFPTTAGAFNTRFAESRDTFVLKLRPAGGGPGDLIYSGLFGGLLDDLGRAIAVDPLGNAYIVGWTNSPNLPISPGAFDVTYNGYGDIFLLKVNSSGSALVYATYLGGSAAEEDEHLALAVDQLGRALVAGGTKSDDFPIVGNAFRSSRCGSMDAFVAQLDQAGATLAFSSYLGGSLADYASGAAVTEMGDIHITGATRSRDWPTTEDAYDRSLGRGLASSEEDAFVAKLNADASSLLYSTYLGGHRFDEGTALALGPGGDIYVVGYTAASDFPTTAGALDTSLGGDGEGFLARFNLGSAGTATPTHTQGRTSTPTGTATKTSTVTQTRTPLSTASGTATSTSTGTASATTTPTVSATNSATASPSATSSLTRTPTATMTSTLAKTVCYLPLLIKQR